MAITTGLLIVPLATNLALNLFIEPFTLYFTLYTNLHQMKILFGGNLISFHVLFNF